MKNLTLVISLFLTLTAMADLCPKCKDMMVTADIGTCGKCRGMTSSGAYKLCKNCSKKIGKCQLCEKDLGGSKPTPKQVGRTINVDEKNNGKTIDAALNDLIVIELEANPSTGYGWSSDPLPKDSGLKFISKKSKRSPQSELLAGAPEPTVLTYQVIRVGQSKIALGYRRPWEKNTKPIKTFSVTINALAKTPTAIKKSRID